jgi:hypothetical protein
MSDRRHKPMKRFCGDARRPHDQRRGGGAVFTNDGRAASFAL